MPKLREYRLLVVIAILIIFSGTIWWQIFQNVNRSTILKVAMLDIGQGDSIYIEAPNGNQIIVDGGPGNALDHALSRVLPFGDHSINMIIVTNPDADHYSGFINLLKNYDVGAVLEPGTISTTQTYQTLKQIIAEKKVPDILARRGMDIMLDKKYGVHLQILFPDRDVSKFKNNDGSIVAKLIYGKTSVMLTGDATKYTESILLSENTADTLQSDILKVGHHGSNTSTSAAFLKVVAPEYAAISCGVNNRYGHPRPETLTALSGANIKTFRTDQLGTILFTSDGKTFQETSLGK